VYIRYSLREAQTPRLDPAHPRQGVRPAQGIGGAGPPQVAVGHGVAGAEPPQSPVFGVAENAPKSLKNLL
jgi:hypothetical protein